MCVCVCDYVYIHTPYVYRLYNRGLRLGYSFSREFEISFSMAKIFRWFLKQKF